MLVSGSRGTPGLRGSQEITGIKMTGVIMVNSSYSMFPPTVLGSLLHCWALAPTGNAHRNEDSLVDPGGLFLAGC